MTAPIRKKKVKNPNHDFLAGRAIKSPDKNSADNYRDSLARLSPPGIYPTYLDFWKKNSAREAGGGYRVSGIGKQGFFGIRVGVWLSGYRIRERQGLCSFWRVELREEIMRFDGVHGVRAYGASNWIIFICAEGWLPVYFHNVYTQERKISIWGRDFIF